MQNCSSKFLPPGDKDIVHFDNSLQELRDLRSQLNNAAELSESTFLNAKHKKKVVENTKEYVCRAMVTLVDHLGCVSDHLDSLLSTTNSFSDVDIRIDCLNQRFALSEQYNHKLALSRFQLMEIVPRHRSHYISTPIKDAERSYQGLSDSKKEDSSKTKDKIKVFEREDKPTLSKVEDNSPPCRHEFSVLPKAPNPSFHFQETRKNITPRARRSRQGSDILALLRLTKRTTSEFPREIKRM